MFSVSYTQTRADVEAFANYYAKIQCGRVYGFVRYCLSPLCLLLGIPMFFDQMFHWSHNSVNSVPETIFFTFCSVMILCLSFWKPFYVGSIWKQTRRHPAFGHPVILQLNDKGVHIQAFGGETLLLWHIITKVERDSDYLFIFISQNSALTVRDELFATPEQRQAFFEFAQTQWQLAHPAPASVPIARPE